MPTSVMSAARRRRALNPLRPLSIAVVAAVVLAGCSASDPAQTSGTLLRGSLVFALKSGAQQDDDLLQWSFLIQNTANATSTPAALHVHVSFTVNGHASDPPVERSLDLPPLTPGDGRLFHVSTPYHGPGDYVGTAEIVMGGRTVAVDDLFYETCAMC